MLAADKSVEIRFLKIYLQVQTLNSWIDKREQNNNYLTDDHGLRTLLQFLITNLMP